jgi:hypothetical protein
MKKISGISVLTAFLLGCAISVQAADVQGIDIGRYGIYKADVIKKEDAEKAAIGFRTVSKNIIFLRQTDTIDATVGTRFGFEYVIKGSPEEAVDIVVKYLHPAITNPVTGKTFTSQEIVSEQRNIGKTELIGYVFDEAWEIVPGRWTILLIYGGQIMAEKTFTIIKDVK